MSSVTVPRASTHSAAFPASSVRRPVIERAGDVVPRHHPVDPEVSSGLTLLLLHRELLLELADGKLGAHFGRPLHDDADLIPGLFGEILRILDKEADRGRTKRRRQRRRRNRLDHLPEEVVAGAQELDVPHIHRGRDDDRDDADRRGGEAPFMDPDDMLPAPEETAHLGLVHLQIRPHGNLGVDDGEKFVEIGDLSEDDGIDPEDLSQFTGIGFLNLFGIGQAAFFRRSSIRYSSMSLNGSELKWL